MVEQCRENADDNANAAESVPTVVELEEGSQRERKSETERGPNRKLIISSTEFQHH